MENLGDELLKKYRYKIYNPFIKAIKEYSLLEENDRVAVCMSGGKDSFLMALCFKKLLEHSDFPFEVLYLLMDPGYKDSDLKKIKDNMKLLDIEPIIFKTNIFKVSKNQDKNNCYLCAKMRRGALYSKAKELGFNKIALGHHFDDVIETLLISILYSGEIAGMRPKLESENYPGIELIRPLYYVREKDIVDSTKEYNLSFLKCGCFMTEDRILCESSKRQIIKKMIDSLDDSKNSVSKNIHKAMSNINIEKMNAYKINGKIIDMINKKNV